MSRPEPSPEELDRFASEIRASWDLDDAPFAAGPAPAAADLAALNGAARPSAPPIALANPQFGVGAKPASAPGIPAAAVASAQPPPAAPAAAPPPVAPVAAPVPSAVEAAVMKGATLPLSQAPQYAAIAAAAAAQRPAAQVPVPPAPASFARSSNSAIDLTTGSYVVPKKRTGLWIGLGIVAVAAAAGVFLMRGGEAPAPPVVAKTAEPVRETNAIPPPPPVEDLPKTTAAKTDTKPEAKPEAKPPEPAKPDPVVAAPKQPEKPRPEPRAERPKPQRPEPPPHQAAPPPTPKPQPKPAPAGGNGGQGGIVRDVPF